jgi:hypothetical protein
VVAERSRHLLTGFSGYPLPSFLYSKPFPDS